MRSDINSIQVSTLSTTVPANGDGRAFTIMANAILGEHFGPWRPYVGAGIGAARVSIDTEFAVALSGLHDDDWAFAAQAFAGIEYQISDRVSVGGRYTYLHIGSTDYIDDNLYGDGKGNHVGLDSFGSHNLEFTLTYRFGG